MPGNLCSVVVLLYHLYYSLLYRHFVRALIILTVIMSLLGVMGTGDFNVLLTPGIAVKLLVLLLLALGVATRAQSATSGTSSGTSEPNVGTGQAG